MRNAQRLEGNCAGESGRRGLDGIGRDENDETARADRDTAFGEEFAQLFDGATHALLRGVFGRPQNLANFTQALVLEVTEENGAATHIEKRPPNREAEFRVYDPDGNPVDLSQHGWPH